MERGIVTLPPQEAGFDYNKRLYNDLTTLLAEAVDGQMRTPFEYRFDGHELYADDDSAMGQIFEAALDQADNIANANPYLSFEVRRRRSEIDEYHDMLKMAKCELPNTMVVVSDFPAELMYASEDLGGYNVVRKQTMLRVLLWQDGCLKMFSQTLDNSNPTALTALYESLNFTAYPGELLGQRMHLELPTEQQDFLIDHLTRVYDTSLTETLGGNWYAGRPVEGRDSLNTYSFVREQRELVQHLMVRAKSGELSRDELYDVVALVQKRLDISQAQPLNVFSGTWNDPFRNLHVELEIAGQEARSAGKTFSACGMTLGAPKETSAEEQIAEAGYGNKSAEDKYGSLDFKCQKGHPNTRPRNKLIDRCKTCGISVRC